MSENKNNANQQQNRSQPQSGQHAQPQYYPKASQAYYPASESANQQRQFQANQPQYAYPQYPPQFPAMYPQQQTQQQAFQQPAAAAPVSPQPAPAPAPAAGAQGMMPIERSYIENILRLNQGKFAHVHMRFEQGGKEGNVRVFEGIIQAAGRDHIVLSDPDTGRWYLLLMIYLDYVSFPEEINYQYLNPFAYTPSLSAYYSR